VFVSANNQPPGHTPLNFRVTDSKTKTPITERVNPKQLKFLSEKIVFVTNSHGPFHFCVDNTGDTTDTISIKIASGVSVNDYSDLPTSKEVQKSTTLFQSILGKLKDINESLQSLRSRDDDLRRTNETIYSRVWWYSCASIGLLLGLGVFQLAYLKTFFKQKKLA
jgi:hypothetical protein